MCYSEGIDWQYSRTEVIAIIVQIKGDNEDTCLNDEGDKNKFKLLWECKTCQIEMDLE